MATDDDSPPHSLHHEVLLRNICAEDKEEMMALHKEFFPVPYSETFFSEMIVHKGINGGHLHTIIAEERSTKRVVGFLLAQLFSYPSDCEDKDLFGHPEPHSVCYILTLGTVRSYRRKGLGSMLIEACRDYAASSRGCGGIYLHVIYYNTTAISFYEGRGFERIRYLEDFYYFDQTYYSAYLYLLCLPGYQPTFLHRLWDRLWRLASRSVNLLDYLVPDWMGWKSLATVTPQQSSIADLNSSSGSGSDSGSQTEEFIHKIEEGRQTECV